MRAGAVSQRLAFALAHASLLPRHALPPPAPGVAQLRVRLLPSLSALRRCDEETPPRWYSTLPNADQPIPPRRPSARRRKGKRHRNLSFSNREPLRSGECGFETLACPHRSTYAIAANSGSRLRGPPP